MPSPMRAKLPTRMTTPATGQLAWDRSMLKNGRATTMISVVRTRACSTPKTAVPMRWATLGTGAISSSLTDRHLLFVICDRPAGENHEHVLQVDLVDRLTVGDGPPQLGRRPLGDDPTADDEGDAVAEGLGFRHVVGREDDRDRVV